MEKGKIGRQSARFDKNRQFLRFGNDFYEAGLRVFTGVRRFSVERAFLSLTRRGRVDASATSGRVGDCVMWRDDPTPVRFAHRPSPFRGGIKQASSPVFFIGPGQAAVLFTPLGQAEGDGTPSGVSL